METVRSCLKILKSLDHGRRNLKKISIYICGGIRMKDKDLLKNGSGYKDPTAYKAIKNVDRRWKI